MGISNKVILLIVLLCCGLALIGYPQGKTHPLNNIDTLTEYILSEINQLEKTYNCFNPDIRHKKTKTYVTYTRSANGFLVKERVQLGWDGISWQNGFKETFTYDVKNNLVEFLFQTWHNMTWINNRRETYDYDENDKMIEHLYQNWEDTSWVNYLRSLNSYEGVYLKEQVRQIWVNLDWENAEKYIYTYNQNDNLTEFLFQNWGNSNWWNSGRFIYEYDGNNNRTLNLYQDWDGTNWVNEERWTYTYELNNNLLVYIVEYWDTSHWENIRRATHIYNTSNNLIDLLWEGWSNSNWRNQSRWEYSYDQNQNMIEVIDHSWDGTNWNYRYINSLTYDTNNNLIENLGQRWFDPFWVNDNKFTYGYDSFNNLIEETLQNWYDSSWVNSRKDLYSYIPTDVEKIVIEPSRYNLKQNYPNPFNPSTTIKYQIPELSFVTLIVYDVLGNEVATLVNEEKPLGNYEVEFNAINLPSGIYFYRLQAGNFVETKKMILMK
jgi:hypothetical protein